MIISVKLTSYSPIHPGKERGMKGKLNKRIFPYIPGTTVYGAMINTFLNFFCEFKENGNFEQCKSNFDGPCKDCFYSKLLRAIKNKTFRISPFLPCEKAISEEYDAKFYNELAKQPHENLMTTLTRTSINTKGTVEEGHLYSLQVHNPLINYYGFIKLPEELKDCIARLLKLLPLSSFGGKGTDALIEGEIIKEFLDESSFVSSLGFPKKIRTITPITFSSHYSVMDANHLISLCEKTQLHGKTYVEMKRKGLYLEIDGKSKFKNYEKDIFISTQVIEGTFYIKKDIKLNTEIFVSGIGNPELNYLGFGQVFFDE